MDSAKAQPGREFHVRFIITHIHIYTFRVTNICRLEWSDSILDQEQKSKKQIVW